MNVEKTLIKSHNNKKIKLINKILICILTSMFLLVSVLPGINGNMAIAAELDVSQADNFEPEYFKSVMDLIKEKYVGEINDGELIEGALKGMFSVMDPYTSYFTPEQAEIFFGDVEGTYEGIGVSMEKSGDYIVITKVFPGSSAEKAGILQGDRIITVDGNDVSGMMIDEVSSRIKGKAGTKVVIGIVRKGNPNIINIEVARSQIQINPVTYEIKNNIGYIKLELFNANADEFMTKALNEMDKSGINKIILDLRDNPGGLVDQCVKIAKNFVPLGLITTLKFKSEDMPDQKYYSDLLRIKYNLVVLVNGNSASASEILAGAVQDTNSGKIVGTKTYGKAKVQSMMPILSPEAYKKYKETVGANTVNAYDLMKKYGVNPSNDEVIGWSKITTGVYLTPKGRMIDDMGIEPDVAVEDPQPVNGIYLNAIQKLTCTWKPDLGDEGADVLNAEKILAALGYEIDGPDNILDEKSFRAVWKFRVDKGLYPGGVLDFTTQKALNAEFEKLITIYDKQYTKAVEILTGNQ